MELTDSLKHDTKLVGADSDNIGWLVLTNSGSKQFNEKKELLIKEGEFLKEITPLGILFGELSAVYLDDNSSEVSFYEKAFREMLDNLMPKLGLPIEQACVIYDKAEHIFKDSREYAIQSAFPNLHGNS